MGTAAQLRNQASMNFLARIFLRFDACMEYSCIDIVYMPFGVEEIEPSA